MRCMRSRRCLWWPASILLMGYFTYTAYNVLYVHTVSRHPESLGPHLHLHLQVPLDIDKLAAEIATKAAVSARDSATAKSNANANARTSDTTIVSVRARSANASGVLEYHSSITDYGTSVGLEGLQGFALCKPAVQGSLSVSDAELQKSSARVSEKTFIERTADCKLFRERYGYSRYPQVTKEELLFPIAFNILLYKEVEQVHVLLRAIYRPHNAYCLHVDGHADPQVLEATQRIASCLPGVFVASRRENITYAGFSRLQADINCMQDHWDRSLNHSTPAWKYLINQASQAFPLKTNLEMVKILTIYNGSNDIEGITGHRRLQQRFTHKYVYTADKTGRLAIVKTEEKLGPPPHKTQVVKGSAYGIFSRGFVDYVLHDQRAKDLLGWVRNVFSPDEYFWATLHHNPHLQVPGGYGDAKKPWLAVYASWPPYQPCASGRIVRGICIFGLKDLQQLAPNPALFANKFYMDFQPLALHCMDQWLYNKSTASAVSLNTTYYRELPFVKRH